jgi:hypothetical protein
MIPISRASRRKPGPSQVSSAERDRPILLNHEGHQEHQGRFAPANLFQSQEIIPLAPRAFVFLVSSVVPFNGFLPGSRFLPG